MRDGPVGSTVERQSKLATAHPTSPYTALTVTTFSAGSAAIILFALAWPNLFADLTRHHPFLAGFTKFFFLGTFGEILKTRLRAGTWRIDRAIVRAIVWGFFGMWFALAFPAFSAAIEGLVAANLWPASLPLIPAQLWLAFSKSFWFNGLGMFGFGLMVTHNYCDFVIANGGRKWSLKAYAAQADAQFLLCFIPKTLLFWIAAQTFNYCMPPEWRVFIAALLAIVLGFLLGVARGKPARATANTP